VLTSEATAAYNGCVQYTIRGIPTEIDKELRRRARTTGKSLNEVVIEALADGLGLSNVRRKRRDLSDIVGTWVEDKDFDNAIADQRRIDQEKWR